MFRVESLSNHLTFVWFFSRSCLFRQDSPKNSQQAVLVKDFTIDRRRTENAIAQRFPFFYVLVVHDSMITISLSLFMSVGYVIYQDATTLEYNSKQHACRALNNSIQEWISITGTCNPMLVVQTRQTPKAHRPSVEWMIEDPTVASGELHEQARQLERALTSTREWLDHTTVDSKSTR